MPCWTRWGGPGAGTDLPSPQQEVVLVEAAEGVEAEVVAAAVVVRSAPAPGVAEGDEEGQAKEGQAGQPNHHEADT
jgi:hypothetical protein